MTLWDLWTHGTIFFGSDPDGGTYASDPNYSSSYGEISLDDIAASAPTEPDSFEENILPNLEPSFGGQLANALWNLTTPATLVGAGYNAVFNLPDSAANVITYGGETLEGKSSDERQVSGIDAVVSSIQLGLLVAPELLPEGGVAEISLNSPATTADLYQYYINMALKMDVSTPENGAVFYSGGGGANQALAEQFATGNNKLTIGMTPGGEWLEGQSLYDADSGITKGQANAVWSLASLRFAQGASGTAVGFVEGASDEGIFNSIEFPELINNSSIVNLITGGF